ncbi:hypothetical protein [Halomonas daqiaonensis]|uniref:hypothetical protein n=1 Tax=Halomonas daqiaonensis TaxID=650850 RepID=UPI00147C5ABB|nr:hypothetical protein [Halomonas daqiaonensis]
MINRCLGDDDFLLDHLGPGFNLLHFSEKSEVETALQQRLAAFQDQGISLTLVHLPE